MNAASIRAVTRQIAVGQGGLLSCRISRRVRGDGASLLNLAFDCGSLNREHLKQGIEALEPDGLDILFISHLDADHVNGVDLLLGKMPVDTVVLPCLDPLTTIAIACGSLYDGEMTGDFRSFLVNPIGWFEQRGVRRVLFIERDQGDEPAPPFLPDNDGPPVGELVRTTRVGEGRLPFTIHSHDNATNQWSETVGQTQAQTLSAACSLQIDLGRGPFAYSGSLAWLLVPYVHPFPPSRLAAFLEAVNRIVSVTDTQSSASQSYRDGLLEILKHEARRDKLKDCYLHLSSDFNKPSLSLFSGPHPRTGRDWRTDDFLGWAWRLREERYGENGPYIVVARHLSPHRNGWLCTGDADLKSKGTRTAWLRRYDSLLQEVGVFVLPPHGSNQSLDTEVMSRVEGAITLACAARGRDKHPHKLLLARLRAQGLGVWQVSEDQESEFAMTVGAEVEW